MPSMLMLSIPFTDEFSGLLAALAHPSHALFVYSRGLGRLPPTRKIICFGYKSKMIVTSILLGITSLLLQGCFGGGEESVDTFLQRIKKEQGGKIEPIPQVQAYEVYTYGAASLKSPFEPSSGFLAHKNAGEEDEDTRPDATRVRDALEEFPLDSFKMVGILRRESQMWGLVVDKKGMIHRIREGNYLGQNSGRVERITDDTIYIMETVSDGQGGWAERQASLTLAE